MSKYAELHLHSLDQFDSDNKPEKVCKRLKELGAKGFALTQHGVLSGIEQMKEAAENYGLKFIPGIEAYYGNDEDLAKNEHLILLSINYQGYRAIWKAVSDKRAQNSQGRAVMNREILHDYFSEGTLGHGNVIATSACINGVVAAKLRGNEVVAKAIERQTSKLSKYSVDEKRVELAKQKIASIEAEIERLQREKEELKSDANAKFELRIKRIDKISDSVEKEYQLKVLNEDMEKSETAKRHTEELTNKIKSNKTRLASFKKEYKALQDESAKTSAIREKIVELESKLVSNETLIENAKDTTREMVEIFGDGNFYMEVQNHGIEMEAEIYPVLANIAREMNVPIVATNDVHTVDNSENELLRRQILRAMRFEQWEEQMVGDDQLYIKTDEEMVEWLSKILDEDVVTEAMNNIRVIFDRCNVVFESEHHYPVFPSKDGKSGNEMLKEEILKGVSWRFPNGLPNKKLYVQRLNDEYKVISKMGYADYHLIVKDFLEYGRVLGPVPDEFIDEAPLDIEEAKAWIAEHGWEGGFTIGPGRGSAAGSLVCYLLGITSIDPIKYDLLFERFLNPERVSMPDIDSDIAKRIRPRVIEYVRAKYGQDAVCGIMTMNAQQPRGAIRIAAKYYGLSKGAADNAFLALSDEMAKKIPNEPGISFASEVGDLTVEMMLKQEYATNSDATTIIDWAKLVEGAFTAYAAHAAGIVISDGHPVDDYIPLRWNNKLQEMTTQVDMNRVESKGLIKMDFLGLKTLDILTDTIRLVKDRTGRIIDPLTDINFDEEDVYKEIFAKARTNSVFQFESDGMKNMLKRFKPDSFEDLIILVSMFRPGPLQYLDGVINVKNGKEKVTFLCPELEPILGKTYGAVVYQEQVMEIFQKLAGYTLGGADQVRRYMSKKKMDKLVHEKESFIHGDATRNIKGCVANGISESVADELFEQMTNFAKYAFNKSHAAAYAFNSYITAWFKYHYTPEFLAAALKWAPQDKLEGLMKETQSFNINVLVPDINYSMSDFTVTDDNSIRFGLSAVKSVGSNAREIIRVREESGCFTSLQDFFEKCNINKKAVENLMWAGAFDTFEDNRQSMIDSIDTYRSVISKLNTKTVLISDIEKILPYIDDVSEENELEELRTVLGVSNAFIPGITTSERLLKRLKNAQSSIASNIAELNDIVIPSNEEDIKKKMAMEKDLLGVYVTGHPLDDYDVPAEYDAKSIIEAEEDKHTKGIVHASIIGVVNSIKKGVSKKKNSYMILEVEDKTASLNVCFFNDACQKFNYIQEGDVFKFSGTVKEESFVTDDDEEKITYSIFCDNVETLIQKRNVVHMSVSSKDSMPKMANVVEQYKSVDGQRAEIHFYKEDKIEKQNYRVNSDILSLNGVSEL